MGNEIEMKKPLDLKVININEIGELIWWSYHLGTYPEKLLSVVNKVGNSADQVRKELHIQQPFVPGA